MKRFWDRRYLRSPLYKGKTLRQKQNHRMQMFPLAGIGAFVAATLASLCCVAPLVLAALGIAGPGAAGLAVKNFEPLRPYLMGVQFMLLGAGFYVTYRKQEQTAGKAKRAPFRNR